MHTGAHLSIPSHRYTHAYTSIRTRMHEEMGYRRTQMEPPMCVCVCASGHPYMPRCTSVDTDAHCTDGHITAARARRRTRKHMRTLPWILYMHSYISMYDLTHTHIYVHVSWARVCRSRRAFARTYAHAHTLAWSLHVQPYAHTCTHT
jgi:hypothetical protein